jgi:CubicO group peptidase (beta-lactamase class C family)
MEKIFLTIVLGIFLTSNSANAQSKVQLLDSLFQTANKSGFFNGNVLVAEKGAIVYQSEIGYADASKTQKLTPELRFNIGSISKGFSAVGMMKLKEQEKLYFDDTISKFIRNLPGWSNKVTIQHLLEYSSGLPNVDYQRIFSDEDAWSVLENLNQLEFELGTGHLYSNYNIFLRERIIEKVSGQTYTAFLKSTIFTPCGMENVAMDPASTAPALAKAFDNKFIQDDYPTSMSGAMHATINDLYQWTECLQDYKVISKASFLELAEGYKTLGLVQIENNDWTMHYHHGSSYNFESSVYISPQDKFTVILMTNNKNFNVGGLTTAADAILRNEPFEIPKKSLYMALRTEIYYNGFESGKQLLAYIKNNEQDLYDLSSEGVLNKTGQYLVGKNKISDGIKTLKFVTSEFPDSWNAYVNLGDLYQKIEENELALRSYKKALALDAENTEIRAKIEKIKAE